MRAFFTGAGPAVIGAIAGSAIPLALALEHAWQFAVLAAAAVWLLAARRGVVSALLGAGVLGVAAVLAGWPVSRPSGRGNAAARWVCLPEFADGPLIAAGSYARHRIE